MSKSLNAFVVKANILFRFLIKIKYLEKKGFFWFFIKTFFMSLEFKKKNCLRVSFWMLEFLVSWCERCRNFSNWLVEWNCMESVLKWNQVYCFVHNHQSFKSFDLSQILLCATLLCDINITQIKNVLCF